jgi:hypothetical protein
VHGWAFAQATGVVGKTAIGAMNMKAKPDANASHDPHAHRR